MIDDVLALLKGVRKTGKDKWLACCPAHDDKKPSMGIYLSSEGNVLATCFSHGCSFESIWKALGNSPAIFFSNPKSRSLSSPEIREKIDNANAKDALRVLSYELMFVDFAIHDIVSGRGIKQSDIARLSETRRRMKVIMDAFNLSPSDDFSRMERYKKR